jgi:hypothetical protein
MRYVFHVVCLLSGSLLVIGCGDPQVADQSDGDSEVRVTEMDFVTTKEPAEATPVGKARESSEDGQEATLVGIIGGSTEPFVDGLAAFTIVDPKVPYCATDEGCPTPWDYCCTQDQVRGNIATVKLVDGEGNPVTQDARGLLGVKELSEVVVSGKVERDDQGNLTLAANQVFVRK